MKMQNNQPKYKFYATLLDAYKWYQVSESDTAEQEFIDKINRVPFYSEAAEKGTAFNEVIDAFIDGKGLVSYNNGFEFNETLIGTIGYALQGSISQIHTSTFINTNYGLVELYGYIDYINQDKAIDLKTTKNYDLGKYKNSMQRHLYPVSLIDNGNEINQFEFLVTDFKDVYSEVYNIDYKESKAILIETCIGMIQFLEAKKNLITDMKVFNNIV